MSLTQALLCFPHLKSRGVGKSVNRCINFSRLTTAARCRKTSTSILVMDLVKAGVFLVAKKLYTLQVLVFSVLMGLTTPSPCSSSYRHEAWSYHSTSALTPAASHLYQLRGPPVRCSPRVCSHENPASLPRAPGLGGCSPQRKVGQTRQSTTHSSLHTTPVSPAAEVAWFLLIPTGTE